jgi:NAD(P)-dependent dehydrogenase (short-subunit alcohol dehydrogenase family)
MFSLHGKVAVVTGAASGIGRAVAVELARRGARLALQDLDEVGLAETARLAGGSALTRRVDVSSAADVQAGADAVLEHHGQVDLVVNNAGIAHAGLPFQELPEADFARVLDVNLWGVVHGSRAYLPHLLHRPEAALVNISSLFGLIGVARQSAYCTSKFAVRGFTESLRMELRETAPHVRTVVVHPGGVKTAIARTSLRAGQPDDERAAQVAAFEETFLRTAPESAAHTIVDGVERGKERVLIGPDATLLDLLARTLPRRYTGLLLRQMRRTEPAVEVASTEAAAEAPRRS